MNIKMMAWKNQPWYINLMIVFYALAFILFLIGGVVSIYKGDYSYFMLLG